MNKGGDAKALDAVVGPTGSASLQTTLTRVDGKTFGAYDVKIELIANR